MASHHFADRIHTGFRVVPLLLAALTALSLFSLPLVHANEAGGPAFGIKPTTGTDVHLRFTIEPGQSQSADVSITNNSTVTGSALSYVADAQTLIGGGFGVASVTDSRTGVTRWVDFPDEVTTLEPGTERIRTVNVEVPEGTPPGDYIVGMAVQEAPDTVSVDPAGEVGILMKTVNRQAMAIMIEVPGERTAALAVGEVSMQDGGNSSIIAVSLSNDGNMHLSPSGKVTVATVDGQELADVDVDFGRFYAHTTSAINLPVEGFLPVGTYVITAEMWDDEADIHTDEIVQQLVVNSRELPNGEQAATLDAGGPVIKAPASTSGSESSIGNGTSFMTLLGVGAGVGIGVVVAGVVAFLFMRRRETATAHELPPDAATPISTHQH